MNIARSEIQQNPRENDPRLWQDFIGAESEEDYFQNWLALQCELIAISVQGLLVVHRDGERYSPVAAWSMDKADPERLSDIVERVIDEQVGLLVELGADARYGAAYPVLIDDALYGVVALELQASSEMELEQAMQQLQWGISWLELLVRRNQLDADQALLARLKSAVDLLGTTLAESSFTGASLVFVTELASAIGCERVSFGHFRGRTLWLEAVSHSAEIGAKMNLTRAIERVMDEAILQRTEIVFPESGDELLITREHEALSRQQAMASIATFPLFNRGRYYGALTCERAANNPFTPRDMEFIRAVVHLAGPALEAKYQNDLNPAVAMWHRFIEQLTMLLGPRHLGMKFVVLALAASIGLLCNTQGDYRLTSDARLEGAICRAVVVPFDGYLDDAPVEAGDKVNKGDLLCKLDDRDLRLEKLAKYSRSRQLEQQYQEAVAKHDRSQSLIVRSQLEQVRAELELLETKLQKTRLVAPFAGLLVSGDLSQRLGSSVEQGETLFEITPLDAYRIILKVDERRIADVRLDQQGMLVLSSLPQEKFAFVVKKLTPIARVDEGRNYFRVEAELTELSDKLRPGMEGVAKIEIDRRRLISIWTRDFVEWAWVKFWAWLP